MCLPGLHISLGIFFRLFTLLEDACHRLDFKLALAVTESDRPESSTKPTSFQEYTMAIREKQEVKEQQLKLQSEAETLEQVATYMSLNIPDERPLEHPLIQAILKEAHSRRSSLSQNVRG